MGREKKVCDVKCFRRNCHHYFSCCLAFLFVTKEYLQRFMCCILRRWKINAYETVLVSTNLLLKAVFIEHCSNVFKVLKNHFLFLKSLCCDASLIDVVYVNFQLIHRLHLKFIPGLSLKLGILMWEWTDDMTGVMLTHWFKLH